MYLMSSDMIGKNQKEKVSIILPVYNGSKFLEKSINSILNQTYQDFIIYICNDASTDNSLDIIKRINSNKIKLFNNKKNLGLSKTRKKIIKLTKGDYLSFIDQDDIWSKKKLEIQVKILQEKNCIMSHSSYTFFNATLNLNKTISANSIVNYEDMKKGCTIGASTVMINKKKLNNTFNFCDDRFFDSANDYVIWLFVLRSSKENSYSYGINKVLTRYNFHGKNLSRNKLKQFIKHFIIIYRLEKVQFHKVFYYSFFNFITKLKQYIF